MTRTFHVNGETMVYVKGAVGTFIANLSELGLSDTSINIQEDYGQQDVVVDAWGKNAAVDMQVLGGFCTVAMTLVHFDREVLRECIRLSMGGGTAEGMRARAGTFMGANNARFAAGWKYISLNLSSVVDLLPWRFYNAYLTGPPVQWPLGTERSVVSLNWRVIPYVQDPWQGGVGSLDHILYDHVLDN